MHYSLFIPKASAHHEGAAPEGGTQLPSPVTEPTAVAASGTTDIPPIMLLVGIGLAVCCCKYFCSQEKK